MSAADPPGGLIPRLTQSSAPLMQEINVRDEFGATRTIAIPAERALTVFVDNRELVTLMTLGAAPELLVLGYLRNQRLVESVGDIESITVDWDVDAAAVKTRAGIERFDEKTAKRVVTTGCVHVPIDGDRFDIAHRIDQPLVAQVAEHQQLRRSAEGHQRDQLAVVDEDGQGALGGDRDCSSCSDRKSVV